MKSSKKPKKADEEKKAKISIDKFLKEIGAVRESDLQQRECPMCKAKSSWHFYKGSYVVAKRGRLIMVAGESYFECRAHNSDHVMRADCMECGFVALFKLGVGPA